MTAIDLIGRRFGRLTVIEKSPVRGNTRQVRWVCRCDCGRAATVNTGSLRGAHTRSCGCLKPKPNPAVVSRSTEYLIWRGIINRCENPTVDCYPNYGGRGISVCDQWRDSFAAFLADVGHRPSPLHSIDRVDVDGDYEPGNCRWVTAAVQVNNRRNTRFVEYRGQRLALTDAVRAAGSVIHPQAAWNRITRAGWTTRDALETPRLHQCNSANYWRLQRTARPPGYTPKPIFEEA